MKIGIIGNGRFGSLLFKVFKDSEFEVVFIDSDLNQQLVSSCDTIIPCVPISAFEEVIKNLASKLSADALVIDVCSVKAFPKEVVLKHLPEQVDILLTHPLFGPDSSEDGTFFKGLKLVFFPQRIRNFERLNKFLKFWEELGCYLIKMEPEKHDEEMAFTQAFAFLIGGIGIKSGIRAREFNTKGFENLMMNQQVVANDAWELAIDIMTFNPFFQDMFGKVKSSLREIDKEVELNKVRNLPYLESRNFITLQL